MSDEQIMVFSDAETNKALLEDNTIEDLPLGAVPVEKIPSCFKPYPGIQIFFIPMKFGELEFLNFNLDDENAIKKSVAFNLENILVYDKGIRIPTENLLKSDFDYVAILRKQEALGDFDCILNDTCTHCKKNISQPFNVTDLKFIEQTQTNAIVNLKGNPITIKPLTVSEYFNIYSENMSLVDMLVAEAKADVKDLIESANLKEFADLLKADKLVNCGIQSLPATCPHCGEITEMEVRDPFVVTFPIDIFK